MFTGEVSGCQDVPDPICPRFMTFDLLAPSRTPMPASDITNGPVSVFAPRISIPGISPMGLAEGLADGIGMPGVCM
jgi:hypothetical protein